MATSSTPQEPPRRGPRSERTHVRLLEAAGQCFAQSGYAKTTVEEIATRAGVSKALVYRHFRSKEQILDEVLAHTLSEWATASHEDALLGGGSALEAIATMYRSGLAWARANPVLHSLVSLDESVLLTVGEETVRREAERFRASMLRAVERGIASGELRADVPAERLADTVRLVYMALTEQLLAPRWMDAPDDEAIEASLEILFRGIAAEGQP